MTILADASAIVAMITNEDDASQIVDELDQHNDRLYCATGAWEAVLAVARKRTVTAPEASKAVQILLYNLGFRIVPIGDDERVLAVQAHHRFGKGTGHPAKLNMGDCFAYACAKANNARLLYKGNDFIHTDLA